MNFEKSHYDLLRNLSRANYYGCKFMFRSNLQLRSTEYIGHFHKRLGDGFGINKCDSDYSFGISLEIDSTLQENKEYHCQLVCLYTDGAGNNRLRILNYSFKASSDLSDFYCSIDVDCCTKLTVMKEINRCYMNSSFNSSHEYLIERVINNLYHYRENCSSESDTTQLVLPVNLRFYPLFINSFLKKPPMLKEKTKVNTNSVTSFIEKAMRIPIYSLIKLIYPRIYRVDDIHLDQSYKKKNKPNDLGMFDQKLKAFNKPDLEIPMLDKINTEGSVLISGLLG